MEKIQIKTNNGTYNGWYQKGTKFNDIAVIYYHGLGGKAKIVKPLLEAINEYDFYSIDERGHIDSFQKASVSIKKHDKDIQNVVDTLSKQYKRIFLCGESMGALFTSRYAYKKNNVNAVFAWSIPFRPKDIMIERKSSKFKIFARVFTTFCFGKNFQYKAQINYPSLTNSKLLKKLHELDVETPNNTAEEIAVWKASLSIKHKFLHKKPLIPIYYWQGSEDIMSSPKIFQKIQKKKLINVFWIENSKHILMFEECAPTSIFNIMRDVIKTISTEKK